MSITRRQFEVLRWIYRFISTEGYSPSYREIGRGLGLTSLATVHKHVEQLENKRFLRTKHRRSRSIDLAKSCDDLFQTSLLEQAAALLQRSA